MHRRPALVLLPLIFALACSPGGGTDRAAPQPAPGADRGADDNAQTDGGDGSASDTPAEAGDENTVTAEPAAQVKGTCTPKPITEDGVDQLVAKLQVVNTGNIGVKVRVVSRWPISRTGGISRWQRLRVDQGETRPVTIRMTVDESTAEEVREGIKRGRRCTIGRRVVGAYGVPAEDS